jgi:hypothetical protein
LIASLVFSGIVLFRYTELDKAYSQLNRTYNELNKSFDELNRTYLSHMPAISKRLATQIALDHGGWDETKLQGMEVSADLYYVRFLRDSEWPYGWGYQVLEPVNKTLTNYDAVTIGNSTYRYVWIVIVREAEVRSIPPPGYYFIDAATGEILPTGLFV